ERGGQLELTADEDVVAVGAAHLVVEILGSRAERAEEGVFVGQVLGAEGEVPVLVPIADRQVQVGGGLDPVVEQVGRFEAVQLQALVLVGQGAVGAVQVVQQLQVVDDAGRLGQG